MKSIRNKILMNSVLSAAIVAIAVSSVSFWISSLRGAGAISYGMAIGLTVVADVLLIGITSIFSFQVAGSLARPIKACAERLKLLSQGDLQTEVPSTANQDETGLLLTSLDAVIQALNSAISDVSYHLGEIAKGDYATTVTRVYKGDFKGLETSTKGIIGSLNETMHQIRQSARQVAAGSEQVAGGAQALSQGAAEQASSIEELSATIAEISQQIKNNAHNAIEAEQITSQAGKELMESNEQMNTMISAMAEISATSNEISKIIKTIDDIAFQTNILALNAAVEAARAGAAGKGFAVVADEVRNLASKSAEAAKNTTSLIESSIIAVDKGTKIADQTARSLQNVVAGAQKSVVLIEQIAAASNEQAGAVTQINQGIEQISSVIQTNSATSEESAAASEELSGQAQMLRELVHRFKLKDQAETVSAFNASASV
jgi:methyl-accepting chemotaxis protein